MEVFKYNDPTMTNPTNRRDQMDRDLETRARLKENIRNIYETAAKHHRSHDALLRAQTTIWNDPSYKKLPRYMKSWLSGYMDALHTEFQRTKVEDIWLFDGQALNHEQIED